VGARLARLVSARPSAVLLLVPVGAGVVAAALWIARPVAGAPPVAQSPQPTQAIPSRLGTAGAGLTDAASCATCHPRQAAEWHRSVMAHAAKSPLFQSLESAIEEQIGRDSRCPDGAGALRKVDVSTACRDSQSGQVVTGAGGEHWCVNCHAPLESADQDVPAWNAGARSRLPSRELLGDRAREGISCLFCHSVHGPVRPGLPFQGNPTWRSPITGATFDARPEARERSARGPRLGIGNSGYDLSNGVLFNQVDHLPAAGGRPHGRPEETTRAYLRSSEFCGACHDVRLFGTDVVGVKARGEHFKRLRNAYSEWVDFAEGERRAGRSAPSCQDCHMSQFPGICEPSSGAPARGVCPENSVFSPRSPGSYPRAAVALGSPPTQVVSHVFAGVDVPLDPSVRDAGLREAGIDALGVPIDLRARRDALLRASLQLRVEAPTRSRGRLEIPVVLENVGAGHRMPAGFSQEREVWVHLRVEDERGRLLYEVGRVDRSDEDLHDKTFLRIETNPDNVDAQGRPLGVFGADVADGRDVPKWSPEPADGGESFRGKGLITLQNGFYRCVRCIGVVDERGRCQPNVALGQGLHRADRYADGDYDLDTGECRSNLSGKAALFETYFPIGALDATRGVTRGPDAILDTRSLPPHRPVRYVYELDAPSTGGLVVKARLLFRAFPPFLLRAFADYEAHQERRGKRTSSSGLPGVSIDRRALGRLDVVELETVERTLRGP
jgi:eukaryotic-like serine/threonine-protein kinase